MLSRETLWFDTNIVRPTTYQSIADTTEAVATIYE